MPKGPKKRRVGPDLAPHLLREGYVLTAPRKGIQFLVVRVTEDRILAKMRKGCGRGRWSKTLYDLAPSEIFNFAIELP